MTAATASERVAHRWWAWLDQVGRSSRAHDRQVVDRSTTTVAEGAPQLSVREVFVCADLAERRSLDLLLAVLVELEAPPESGRLYIVGPEALRARSVAGSAGFVISELGFGPVTPDARVSLALLRVDHAGRARDVASSIDSLGKLLDYPHDLEGSTAVANAVLRRLEVLTAAPGVRVSVAGLVAYTGDQGPLHLLTDAPLALDNDVELRDGRLMVVTASRDHQVGRERRAWSDGDYALLRVGAAEARRATTERPLAQRKVEHALAELNLGTPATRDAGSYSSRNASARQAALAQEILDLATSDDQDQAAATLAHALTQPGASGPLVESVVTGVDSVPQFWSVLPVVERGVREAPEGSEAHTVVCLLRTRLHERLDRLLKLLPEDGSEYPVTTPIVIEVSDALLPAVDSRQDNAHFLFELVPAMRERLRNATGLWIPGVRARGNPNLLPGMYNVAVDEVPVFVGTLDIGVGGYRARPLDEAGVPDDLAEPALAEVDEIDPLTGTPGRFLVEHTSDGSAPDTIPPARYLVHRLEMVLRGRLSALLGLQELTALLNRWRAVEPDLVGRAVVGPVATERLTALVQGLVAERIPFVDWRAILDTVVAAGGLDTPLGDLHQAVRMRLRAALPGPRSGPAVRTVPPEIQADLCGKRAGGDPAVAAVDRDRAQIQFTTWLHNLVNEHRSVVSLVTDTTAARVAVATLARGERAVVLTFTAEEVASA